MVYGHCLVTLPLTINETLNGPHSLPRVQCGNHSVGDGSVAAGHRHYAPPRLPLNTPPPLNPAPALIATPSAGTVGLSQYLFGGEWALNKVYHNNSNGYLSSA